MRYKELVIENEEEWAKLYKKLDSIWDSPDKEYYYIRFTTIPKLGINPNYQYSTPAGIYAYPFDPTYKIYSKNLKYYPFASDYPYVHLIKVKNKVKKLVIQDINENDVKFLENFVLSKNLITEKLIEEARETALKNKPDYILWNITRYASKEIENDEEDGKVNPFKWNKIFRMLGYDVIDDFGEGVIHPNERYQSLILHVKAIENYETYENPKKDRFGITKRTIDISNTVAKFIKDYIEKSSSKILSDQELSKLLARMYMDLIDKNVYKVIPWKKIAELMNAKREFLQSYVYDDDFNLIQYDKNKYEEVIQKAEKIYDYFKNTDLDEETKKNLKSFFTQLSFIVTELKDYFSIN